MKLELRKSLVIAGLERKTGGEKLSSKVTMGNSYTGVILCISLSTPLFNIYVSCKETQF